MTFSNNRAFSINVSNSKPPLHKRKAVLSQGALLNERAYIYILCDTDSCIIVQGSMSQMHIILTMQSKRNCNICVQGTASNRPMHNIIAICFFIGGLAHCHIIIIGKQWLQICLHGVPNASDLEHRKQHQSFLEPANLLWKLIFSRPLKLSSMTSWSMTLP